MGTALSIGKLAEMADVNVETIRYYQRRGLLDLPARPPGSHRRYGREQAQRLRFIKRAQALGFSLAEVGGLLTLDKACACGETRTLAARKVALIEQKIADLAAMRKVLATLVEQCDRGDHDTACPIIDELKAD